jgi:hypothetical protein
MGSNLNRSSIIMDWKTQAMNSATVRKVGLTNVGTTPITISSVQTVGDFSQTNNCRGSIPAGATCALTITFRPTGTGERYGMVVVNDSDPASPHPVRLMGMGQAAQVSTAALTFGAQTVGTTSAAQAFTLKNTGPTFLNIAGITPSGDFAVAASTCGTGVGVGGQCSISVVFSPTASGTRTGMLQIVDNDMTSPQIVNLTGTGN